MQRELFVAPVRDQMANDVQSIHGMALEENSLWKALVTTPQSTLQPI